MLKYLSEDCVGMRLVGSGMIPSHRMTVTKLDTWQEVENLKSPWEVLASRQITPTIFMTWQWSKSWWITYGGVNPLYVLVVRNKRGEVVGIAPFFITRKPASSPLSLRVLRFIGSNDDSGMLDILASPDFEQDVWKAILTFLEAASDWDILELTSIVSQSSSHEILAQELKERKWNALYHNAPLFRIHLPDSWENFLSGLSYKLRRSVRRAERRLQGEYEVVFRQCTSVDEIPLVLNHLFDLNSRRWAAKGIASAFNEVRKRFYFELSNALLQKSWLDVWELVVSGRVVAVEFGFRYLGSSYRLQSGFDPEFAAYGVGQVLESFLIRRSIENRDHSYDLLAGARTYKSRWGAEHVRAGNFRCAKPRSLGSLAVFVGRIIKRNSLYR